MGDNPYADLEAKYANNIAQQNDLLNQSEQINNQQIDENNKFVLDNIEQQRGYAKKDFQKEARGAYQDYQKLVNPYGVQAENIFSNGLGNSGYSETSKLNAYNTYQNRYATAKESTDRLMQDFNNQMTQAGLEANAQKAQFALQKLQTQMSNLWQQLDFDSTLAQNKTSYNQWLESFNYQKEQDRIANEFAREQFEYQKQQDAIANSYRGSSGGYGDYNPLDEDYGEDDGGEGGGTTTPTTSGTQNSGNGNRNSVLYQGPNTNRIGVSDVANELYSSKIPSKSVQEAMMREALMQQQKNQIVGALWNR